MKGIYRFIVSEKAVRLREINIPRPGAQRMEWDCRAPQVWPILLRNKAPINVSNQCTGSTMEVQSWVNDLLAQVHTCKTIALVQQQPKVENSPPMTKLSCAQTWRLLG